MRALTLRLAALVAVGLWGACGCAQTSAPVEGSLTEQRLANASGEERAYFVGLLRAEAVRDGLVALGVEPERIEVASQSWWRAQASGAASPVHRNARIVPLDGASDARARPVAAAYSPALGDVTVETGLGADTIYFASGSWELGSEAQRTLRDLADRLRRDPDARIRIEGGADRSAE